MLLVSCMEYHDCRPSLQAKDLQARNIRLRAEAKAAEANEAAAKGEVADLKGHLHVLAHKHAQLQTDMSYLRRLLAVSIHFLKLDTCFFLSCQSHVHTLSSEAAAGDEVAHLKGHLRMLIHKNERLQTDMSYIRRLSAVRTSPLEAGSTLGRHIIPEAHHHHCHPKAEDWGETCRTSDMKEGSYTPEHHDEVKSINSFDLRQLLPHVSDFDSACLIRHSVKLSEAIHSSTCLCVFSSWPGA